MPPVAKKDQKDEVPPWVQGIDPVPFEQPALKGEEEGQAEPPAASERSGLQEGPCPGILADGDPEPGAAEESEPELLRMPLLKDKAYTLSALKEVKVNGKAAVGVKVAAKGHKDIELYFDKDSGLQVKTVRVSLDPQTMKDVSYEVIYSDIKEFNGVKHATKALVNQDGKKYMEMEITEFKALDKVDEKEFAKP